MGATAPAPLQRLSGEHHRALARYKLIRAHFACQGLPDHPRHAPLARESASPNRGGPEGGGDRGGGGRLWPNLNLYKPLRRYMTHLGFNAHKLLVLV